MKNTILFLFLSVFAFAQSPINVQKGGFAGTNNITGDLNIGSGRTLTIASGGTIVAAPGSTVTGFGGGGGSGTVTSVALSLPGIFAVSGSPVTTAGTLTGTLATQSANLVWAGPTTGGAAAPTFRSLVPADIPTLTLAKISDAGTLASQNGTFSGVSSGTNTGDQNLFGSVVVSGQTTVTPASTNQALTLVAGANVTLTTDNTAKSVTITAAGGGGGGTPGGTSGQVQYNNAGSFGGFTVSGDATLNTSTGVATLATVNSNVGSFGSPTQAGVFTINAKGLITAASSATVTPAVGSITGLGTGVPAALAVAVGSPGAPVLFNGAGGTPSSLTLTNATGLPVAGGGTGVASVTAYAPIFGGTTSTGSLQSGTVGTAGQVLTSNGAGALPTFQAPPGGSTSWGSTVGVTDVASASTVDLGAQTSAAIRVTGTTTVTGFGTVAAGTLRTVYFAGALTLTHNGTSLILPGAANVTTAANDRLTALSLGSGNWIVTNYSKADGTPLVVGANLNYGTNPTEIVVADSTVNSSGWTTTHGYKTRVNGLDLFEPYATYDGSGNVTEQGIRVNGGKLLQNLSAYATGTVYSLTNTAAALSFGTTSPTITIPTAGTWKITARVQLAYAGATVSTETATLKLRRTNNTAADLTNGSLTVDLPVATTLTNTYGTVTLPPVYYTTLNANDVVTIFGNVSATLGAGTINCEVGGTNITAERLY